MDTTDTAPDRPASSAIPRWAEVRGRLGNAIKSHRPLHEQDELRVEMGAARLADLIERTVATVPPLRPEHVAALHTLLDAAVEIRGA